MKAIARTMVFCSLMLLVGFATILSNAQDRRGPGGPFGDPEEFMQRIMSMIQERMGASDEEWKVIQPRLEKVWEAQRESRSGGPGFGFFGPPPGGGPGGPGGPDGQQGDDNGNRGRRGRRGPFGGERSAEYEALSAVLENANSTPDEIQEKLTALREYRKKKQEELKQAQDELRLVLTLRQEGMMVLMGTLE